MQMLLLWRRRKGARATVNHLIKYLVKLQQNDLAEELAEMVEIEMDEMSITPEPEQPKNKPRTKHSLKVSSVGPKRGRGSSRRGQVAPAKPKREYFSQSSGFSSENGYPSSPDSEPQCDEPGMRVSESSEGYQSSGSHKIKPKPQRHSKDRPHVKIPKNGAAPDVEIKKDQVPKRTSRLRQQQQNHSKNDEMHEQNGEKPMKLTCAHGAFGSNDSTDSDLIVSEGGSDVAEESDVDEQDEVATSTMLDCADGQSTTGTDTEECSSIEPTSPDSLIHQTVPKTLDDSYTLEHVVV